MHKYYCPSFWSIHYGFSCKEHIHPDICYPPEEVEDLGALGDFLVDLEDLSVGHPLIAAEATVRLGRARAHEGPVGELLLRKIEGIYERRLFPIFLVPCFAKKGQQIEVFEMLSLHRMVYQICRVALDGGLIRSEVSVGVGESIGRSRVRLNHLILFKFNSNKIPVALFC